MTSFVDLSGVIDKNQTTAMNVADLAALGGVLGIGDSGGVLASDADVDHQMLISVTFQSAVKLHDIMFKADTNPPANASGPATVHIFIDRPHLDFAEASSSPPIQTLSISEKQLGGEDLALRFVRFQNVHSVQLFIETNHDNEDVTFLNRIAFKGVSVQGMNMADFKDAHADHDH